MNLEVLHIVDCPNWEEAGARVSRALASLGRSESVTYRLINSPEEATSSGFGGSPTITLDGTDLFPGEQTADLACRVYITPAGLAGLPTQQQVSDALAAAL
ncbi:thioredoxin family protein [Microbacterium sp. NPDC028030]|uniref:thioredoxin family protein n=1 Tax=Microbacterium sp. NPDC028030 TaxID=3155124 RepID=UPI0033F6D9A4